MEFVNLKKDFENVEWIKLFVVLRNAVLKWRDRRIIGNIYKDQIANTGVRYPIYFSTYFIKVDL